MVGAWLLQTINGQPLPSSETISGTTYTTTSESLVFASNNTFVYNYAWTQSGVGGVQNLSDSDAGVFSVSGSSVTLNFNTFSIAATVSGANLTLTADGDTYIFRKQ
jgi:hypothetical protein